MLNFLKDDRFVKVTKENWKKIEELFESKEKQISEIQKELDVLRKYKEKDDLLFSYEQTLKKKNRIIKELCDKVENIEFELKKTDRKLEAALSLEKAYIKKIIKTEAELLASKAPCPDYEEKGENIIGIYS
jgi:chromosome segregation ATPase